MFVYTDKGYVNSRYIKRITDNRDKSHCIHLDDGTRAQAWSFDERMLAPVVPNANENLYVVRAWPGDEEGMCPVVDWLPIVAFRIEDGYADPVTLEELHGVWAVYNLSDASWMIAGDTSGNGVESCVEALVEREIDRRETRKKIAEAEEK